MSRGPSYIAQSVSDESLKGKATICLVLRPPQLSLSFVSSEYPTVSLHFRCRSTYRVGVRIARFVQDEADSIVTLKFFMVVVRGRVQARRRPMRKPS